MSQNPYQSAPNEPCSMTSAEWNRFEGGYGRVKVNVLDCFSVEVIEDDGPDPDTVELLDDWNFTEEMIWEAPWEQRRPIYLALFGLKVEPRKGETLQKPLGSAVCNVFRSKIEEAVNEEVAS